MDTLERASDSAVRAARWARSTGRPTGGIRPTRLIGRPASRHDLDISGSLILMGLRQAVVRAKVHARRPLARTPYLWDLAMYARPGKRATLATPDSAIIIDGYPRSGNTFSVAAFEVANGHAPHVGRHLHGPAHILRGVRFALPTVVLIRPPRDAVLSYLVRRDALTPDDAVLEYLDFYRTAWLARDGFVIGLFGRVVSDFGAVLDEVNERFGTSFVRYVPTPENEEAAFARVEEMNRLECGGVVVETHVGRPSQERTQRKDELRALLDRPRTAARLRQAEGLYEDYEQLAISRLWRRRDDGATGPADS